MTQHIVFHIKNAPLKKSVRGLLAELPVVANTAYDWKYRWINSLTKLSDVQVNCLITDELADNWQPEANAVSERQPIVIMLIGPQQLQDLPLDDSRISDYLPIAFLNAALLEKCLASNLLIASLQRQIMYLKDHDATTGLATKSLFREQLDYTLEKAKRDRSLFAIMAIRIDNFSDLLGKLGHSGSEPVLRAVAQRLAGALSKGDLIAKGAGGEFLVLVDNIAVSSDVGRIAGNILKKMHQQPEIDEAEPCPTVSIGIGCYPESGANAASLMAATKDALSLASATGDEFRMLNKEVANISKQRFEIEQALPQALTRHELEVFYQPQCNLETGKVSGAEALLKWYRPTLGVVPADQFIPIAEASDAILTIGEWVLREALSEVEKWLKVSTIPPRLAVNVSGKQFKNNKILSDIETLLENTSIPKNCLELEITEHVFVENIESHRNIFKKLREIGVSIALDDFGIRYSALNYLKHFAVDTLKIDKSFIKMLPDSKGDAAIVRAIITMGHNLNMRVIAEGVEQEAQLEFLHDHKCDEVQGHLFSPSLPADQFIRLLDKDGNQDIGYVDASTAPVIESN